MSIRKLRTAQVLGFATLLLAAACGDSPVEPAPFTPGAFDLATIDGAALPYTVFQGQGYRLEILSSRVTLATDGTFTSTAQFRETVDGVVETTTENESGTYTVSGGTLRIVIPDDDDSPYTATVGAGQLDVRFDGMTYRFRAVVAP